LELGIKFMELRLVVLGRIREIALKMRDENFMQDGEVAKVRIIEDNYRRECMIG